MRTRAHDENGNGEAHNEHDGHGHEHHGGRISLNKVS